MRDYLLVTFGFFGSNGVGFSGVDGAIRVMRRRVESIELEICFLRSVDDIVFCTSGDDDGITVLEDEFLNVDNGFAFSLINSEKLIVVGVDLHTDFLTWFQAHDNKLSVVGGKKNFSKILIVDGLVFEMGVKTWHI